MRQLSEAAWTQASLLPAWTRAHVVTHLAQNADGGVRRLTGGRTRVPNFEYESVAARAVAINVRVRAYVEGGEPNRERLAQGGLTGGRVPFDADDKSPPSVP